jgi:ABC-type amino acid transport substrate-binding protein
MQRQEKLFPNGMATLVGAGFILLVIVGTLTFFVAKGKEDQPGSGNLLDQILARGVIRVSTDANAPPQSSLKPDGTCEGFDIDVVKVGKPVFVETLAVAFDKHSSLNSSSLRDKVSEIIEAMHTDGTLSKFSKKWFDGSDLTIEPHINKR